MEERPLISVVMAAYNAAPFLPETIASVLAQTYTHWELLIVDDGSTDDTARVVKEFTVQYPQIHYFWQENGRQGKARNLGLHHARGEWVAFLDADDLWVAEKLDQQLAYAKAEGADLVYTTFQQFDHATQAEKATVRARRLPVDQGPELLLDLLMSNPIGLSTVLVKKRTVLQAGGFPEEREVQNAEDYALWLKLAKNGLRFKPLRKALVKYRVHAQQVTAKNNTAFGQAMLVLIPWIEGNALNITQKRKVLKSWLVKLAALPASPAKTLWQTHSVFFEEQLQQPWFFFAISLIMKCCPVGWRKSAVKRFIQFSG